MAREAASIVLELVDEPHVAGRRVTVLKQYERVDELGKDPHAVAEEYDLDVAAVYNALAYYHTNPEQMSRIRTRRETIEAQLRETANQSRPVGLSPPPRE